MKTIAGIAVFFIVVIIGASVIRSCNDTADTVHKEFSTSAMLKKYEYFKDLAAAIDKKKADIEVYRSELEDLKKSSNKDDHDYYLQRRTEMLGIITMHNELVSEYNSGMSKFNYRFANRGTLPQSNLEPLPREYQDYILKSN